MGQPSHHPPVLLLLAAFSRHGEALDWARQRAVEAWGPIERESPRFDFSETHYYDATMGPGLKKVFYAFQRPIDPAELVEVKLQTNGWEEEYAAMCHWQSQCHPDVPLAKPVPPSHRQSQRHPTEPRPLNLDPGYLTLAKLVLASTKDFAHRIYLGRGIYAEITLQYKHRRWEHHPYTFPDYRRADYQEFFTKCRERLKGIGD